jgi:5-(carboxyamino)imidazole ribonucleotide mutase
MGSDSDLAVMIKAIDVLKEFGISPEVSVASAHRTPDNVAQFARNAADNGIQVIIAGAGMAAALPGVIAAHTTLPVIGVPLSGSALHGTDALYAMVQMPPGIPVATVGIDAATNAGLLAAAVLALNDAELAERLCDYRAQMAARVEKCSEELQERL